MPPSPTSTQHRSTAALLRWGVSEQRTSATAAGSQRVNASMGVRSRSPLPARGENLASTGGSAHTAARMPAQRPGSSGGATPRAAPMASGQRRVDSASARCGHDSDVAGDQLGMSRSGGGRRGMSSPEGVRRRVERRNLARRRRLERCLILCGDQEVDLEAAVVGADANVVEPAQVAEGDDPVLSTRSWRTR